MSVYKRYDGENEYFKVLMIYRIIIAIKIFLRNESQKDVDSQDTLCYDVREVKNLKESEVIMMLTVKFEIAIEYSMKTSVCAY